MNFVSKTFLLSGMLFLTATSLAWAQDKTKLITQEKNTLYNALELAYQNNPTIRAARAEFLATQEKLPQAQAGFKPSISADADITYTDTQTDGTNLFNSDGGHTSKSGSLNLSQPLFRGGRTLSEISAAKNIINAQSLNLSAVEQGILYDGVVAYMDALRDQSVLKLKTTNKELVRQEQTRAEARFSVGELTRTDVAQAQARLAEADADVIAAEGDLKRAIATYQKIIGSPPPTDMTYPQETLELPATLEESLALAESNNRNVLIAKFIKESAQDDIKSRAGVFLPEISAIGRLDKSYNPSDLVDEQRQAAIGITASIPLYSAGKNLSSVREARKIANQRTIQIIEAQDKARQETVSSWESLSSAQAEVKARQAQIDAARIAQEGINYELEFGERTTLDALDANRELLNAEVNLTTAKRDEVVARFALGRSLGVLVPQRLGFSSITP